MVDFLGEAMMKKQESNLGLVLCLLRQDIPLCCEVGYEVVQETFNVGIGTKYPGAV